MASESEIQQALESAERVVSRLESAFEERSKHGKVGPHDRKHLGQARARVTNLKKMLKQFEGVA